MDSANDASMPNAIPTACCGNCDNWGEFLPSRRSNLPLGMCYVRRGSVTVYTAPGRACDVMAAGQLMFRAAPVLA